MNVGRGSLQCSVYDEFLVSAAVNGHPISPDLNAEQPEGFACLQATKQNGKRCSTATAFLKPALARPNLEVVTLAHVNRIIIDNGRAIAVEYICAGETLQARASSEIILCGGAINSPQLLQLSGIGPPDALRRHDIEVHADLPGVGANLQDHADIILEFSTAPTDSVAWIRKPWWQAYAAAQWMIAKTGLAASNVFEVGGVF